MPSIIWFIPLRFQTLISRNDWMLNGISDLVFLLIQSVGNAQVQAMAGPLFWPNVKSAPKKWIFDKLWKRINWESESSTRWHRSCLLHKQGRRFPACLLPLTTFLLNTTEKGWFVLTTQLAVWKRSAANSEAHQICIILTERFYTPTIA